MKLMKRKNVVYFVVDWVLKSNNKAPKERQGIILLDGRTANNVWFSPPLMTSSFTVVQKIKL